MRNVFPVGAHFLWAQCKNTGGIDSALMVCFVDEKLENVGKKLKT